jgi:hypothetical protein
MFSTFADVFGSDDSHPKQINGTNNPFNSSSTTTNVDPFGVSSDMKLSASSQKFDDDPFGISSDMKLSASSQKFDDSPFVIDTPPTISEHHTGKDALSSLKSNAYQNNFTTNEQTLDPLEDIQTKSSSNLSINNTITHSKSINLINPFSIPTIPNEVSTVPIQASPIDLLFDLNIDPSTLPTTNADKSLTNSVQVQSSYDLLGLNKKTSPSPTVKVLKSDSLTDIQKISQTKKSSQSSLTAKSTLPTATSFHSMPINAPPTSPSTLRVQATALSILTGTAPSPTPFDDQFLDWLTQSDDLMCGVDPKLTGLSKKIDINMLKSTEDLLGSIYKQVPQSQPLPSLQETSHEVVPPPPPPQPIRRPSNEEVPAICIHEPTSDHDDNNVVPQGYFDNKKQNAKDSDDSEDEKMVFKIEERKSNTSLNETNIPVPLLPPPPSPSTSKKYKEASDDAGSSSSETDNEDENDPLAIFRSKSTKNTTNQKQGNNLITDWEEQEDNQEEEDRVCLMSLYVYLLLSCLCYHCLQGSCCLIFIELFFFLNM